MTSKPTILAGEAYDCTRREVVHQLYSRLGRALVLRTERVTRRQDVAQEIVQETFVRLWNLGPKFANERAAYSWVYKTSHRLALDHLRSGFTRTELIAGDDLDEVQAGGARADRTSEDRQLLARLVARLGPEEADYFVLQVVDGMKHQEIAELAGVSTKTVSRILQRAEAKLERAKVRLDVTRT